MHMILSLLLWLSCVEWANAASLVWEYGGSNVPAQATIQRGATATGTFTTIATIPSTPALYPLPATPDNQFYRVQNTAGVSNVIQYTADPSAPIVSDARIAAIEAKNTEQDASLASHDGSITVLNKASQDAVSANLQQDQQITTMSQSMTDSFAALNAALATVNAKIAALENQAPPPPPPAGDNLKATVLNIDQIEITGLNCASLKTSGTGLKRVITCVH